MAFARSIGALVFSSLVIATSARIAPLRKLHQHQHEAIKVGKRQSAPPIAGPPPEIMASTIAPTGVLTYVTPSPSASPVAVTQQSQIVTSFVPQFTLCELPPMEYLSITPLPISAQPSNAPYQNYSISISAGNGTCTTIYSPTVTMVCATILTALVDKYTVSQCAQDLTFSTEYGYVLVTPTLPPSIPTSMSNLTSSVQISVSLTSSVSVPNIIFLPSSASPLASSPTSSSASSMSAPYSSNSFTTNGTPSITASLPKLVSSTDITSVLNIVPTSSIFSTPGVVSTSGLISTSNLVTTPVPVTTPNVVATPNIVPTSNILLKRDISNDPTTITPGPSIQTITTYYMAPWQDLTAGTVPTDIDLKVCRTFASDDTTECIREYQVWSTSLVTMTTTSVTSINISTTIHGMSQVLVETFVANITEQLTTFSMSTTMNLEFETEWTTTQSSTRTLSTSTGPTVYETLTVAYASSTPTPAASQDTTSTTTIHLTSTIYIGTSTVTIPTASAVIPSAPAATTPSSTSVDFAAMLGIGGK